jgi:pimeloyl-ACP methyl ester carboxylesterase
VTALTTKRLSIDGIETNVVECGAGDPLLLVHGFIVSHKEWLPVLPALAARFRCIVPDLPGFGASAKPLGPDAPYGWVRYARFLTQLLDALGVDSAHVAGHSMGGGVSLTFAADHPTRIRKLAAIDAACYPFPLPLKARITQAPGLGPLVFKRFYGRALFHDYFRNDVWSGHAGIDLEQVDEYYRDFNAPGARDAAYEVMLHSMNPQPVADRVKDIQADTLVLWGADDRLFDKSLAERLAREIPRAKLTILEGVAHTPHEERPAETAKILLEHFTG